MDYIGTEDNDMKDELLDKQDIDKFMRNDTIQSGNDTLY